MQFKKKLIYVSLFLFICCFCKKSQSNPSQSPSGESMGTSQSNLAWIVMADGGLNLRESPDLNGASEMRDMGEKESNLSISILAKNPIYGNLKH